MLEAWNAIKRFFNSDDEIEDSETGKDYYSNEIMYISTLYAFLKQWIFILLGFFIFRKLLK
jgi:hypothetical protein